MVELTFWICTIGILMPYLIYPIGLFICSRFRSPHQATGKPLFVTFVISAYNERGVIGEKIENTLGLNYPPELLQIIVISDESNDGTDEIVDRYERVTLIRQSPRRGKSAGINASFGQFQGEVIVFSDANAIYDREAISFLVRHFEDSEIGYVVGRQMYHTGKGGAQESENTYWDFELRLKAWESRLSSVVGGDGAIMAIRRDLFSPLSFDDINDFVLPLRMVAQGFRGIFEPQAVCYEEAAPSFQGEFRRKVRIVNRSLRAVWRVPQTLNPFRVGIFSLQLVCHKVVRWFAIYLMIGALLTSGWLAIQGSWSYLIILMLQMVFYLIALIAHWTSLKKIKLATLVYYFCLANVAGGIGTFYFLLGRKFATWTPQRETGMPGADENG